MYRIALYCIVLCLKFNILLKLIMKITTIEKKTGGPKQQILLI